MISNKGAFAFGLFALMMAATDSSPNASEAMMVWVCVQALIGYWALIYSITERA